jgi:hypothetical protein
MMMVLIKAVVFTGLIVLPVIITSNAFPYAENFTLGVKLVIWVGLGLLLVLVFYSSAIANQRNSAKPQSNYKPPVRKNK